MIWAGSPFARHIEFSAGAPTGAVSYRLLGNDGATALTSGTYNAAGALDLLLMIPGEFNTCDLPLIEMRTLVWDYPTETGLQSGRESYTVARPIPFAVSIVGVRNKLGLSNHELAEENIDLAAAYSEFSNLAGAANVATAASAGDRTTLLCLHAIEAMAAFALLPSIQLRAAQQESSGTNKFARFTSVDWDRLDLELRVQIDRARAAIDLTFDADGQGVFSFGVAPRDTDAFTGDTNS